MPQIMRASHDDPFPPLRLNSMNTSPHLLTAFLIQVILATIYQNGPLCLFQVLSYDLTNPLSHLFQVCAVVMFILEMGKLRLGQGKRLAQDHRAEDPESKLCLERSCFGFCLPHPLLPPPAPLAPHLSAPGGLACGLVLGTCGCTL